jgi:tetratricopeptide (TPR) repeat protein
MKYRGTIVVGVFIGACGVLSQTAWGGQGIVQAAAQASDSIGPEEELKFAQDLYMSALDEFNSDQPSRSIALFGGVITALEALRAGENVPTTVEEMLVHSFELRARAYFDLGSTDEARDAFRSLIRIRSQHELNSAQVSPKVIQLFETVKKSMVGSLAVSSEPSGATVTVNAKFLGLTDFFPLDVVAGPYVVKIEREGYAPESRSLTIVAGEVETLEVELQRVAASLLFITEPSGVEVWIDGELRGTTAGSLPPDFVERAVAAGLEPTRASAETEVPNLSLASHQVEYRKHCYTTVRTVIDTTEAIDYTVPALRMEPSLGTLSLTSDPPGAQVFIDSKFEGFTPKELDGICSGKMRLEVKHTSGKFVQDIELGKNETLSMDCPIRPSLAFLGVVRASASGTTALAEVEDRITESLSSIPSLNFLTGVGAALERVLEREGLTLEDLVPAAGTPPDVTKRVGKRLADALEVQGFLIAYLPEERLQRTALLHLLAAGNAQPDTQEVEYASATSYLAFTSKLNREATVLRSWMGLVAVDTLLHEGVPVLRVIPNGPAAKAGVAEEEEIVAADGKPVRSVADLRAIIEAKELGESLDLALRSPGGDRSVELELEQAPQQVALHDESLFYNKVMMDLRQAVEGYPGTSRAAYARLNLAICAMHFRDYAQAHEYLTEAQGELPDGPGISKGTALYYLGLALERLGYAEEARDAYRQAATHAAATLFDNDGPLVAPLATQRAEGP